MYYLRNRLQSAGFDIGQSESPIFPIMVRDNEKVYKIADMLQKFSEFVKGYDYWFSDIADKAMKSSDNPKDKFVALMDGLQEALKEKSVMQELLRWKLLREMTRPRGQPCFVKHSHFPLQRNTKLCLKTHALTLLRLPLFL